MSVEMNWLYDMVGEFGLYQGVIFGMLCVPAFVNGITSIYGTFLSASVDHRCLIPNCDDGDPSFNEDFLNFTTKFRAENKRWDRCSMYPTPNGNNSCEETSFNPLETVPCANWVYDKTQFSSTTVTEFDLVCEKSWLAPLGGSCYMLGMFIGSFLTGYISDRYGRKKGLCVAIFISGCGGLIASFSPNFLFFLAMRFISGVGTIGLFQLSFVIAIEFVGLKWRTFCGIMIEIPYAIGEAYVGVIAYFVRDFRLLQIICIAPTFLLLSYIWLLPESIRWLLAVGRKDDALKIVKKFARINGRPEPKTLGQDCDMQTFGSKFKGKISIFEVLKLPNMRKRTLILFYCWCVCTLIYYGISLSSAKLSGNMYINFIATMLIEIPGYIFSYFALDRLGRKGTLMFVYIFGGAACISAGFLPRDLQALRLILNLCGKFGISAAFASIFIYTAELFPTDYRSLGVGTCSMFARVGAVAAPFIANLSDVYTELPVLIFGALSFIAGIVILKLPETSGFELPQTLDQSEFFGMDQPLYYCVCCKSGRRKSAAHS